MLDTLLTKARDVAAREPFIVPIVRPWDTSEVAFAEIVAAEDGHVTFGFKEPESGRLRETGVREAVSKNTVQEGLRLVAEVARIRSFRVYTGAASVIIDPNDALRLRNNPLIDYAEPRRWGRIDGVPMTRTTLPLQGSELMPWGVDSVRAPEAWSTGAGVGAKVLIIDTGYQRGHEDLPVAWLAHCAGEFDGCEDDGSVDYVPHGTFVSGIAVARDNSIGVVGVAPQVGWASFYSWGACSGETRLCSQEEVGDALDVAMAWNIDVVNMSLSYDTDKFTDDLADAVEAAAFEGDIVLVASAGNNKDNELQWPAASPGVIGVSGVVPSFAFASMSPGECDGARSNWGQHVDIAGPFYALSTVPFSEYEDWNDFGWCGNSFSTPHVTGAVAIMRGKYDLTRDEVMTSLFDTAVDANGGGWDDHLGWGVLDVDAALEDAESSDGGGGGGPDCEINPEACTPERKADRIRQHFEAVSKSHQK